MSASAWMLSLSEDVAAVLSAEEKNDAASGRQQKMTDDQVQVAGLDLMAAKLVGELGYQTGKDEDLSKTYTDFDPKAGHVYGGIGLRVSF